MGHSSLRKGSWSKCKLSLATWIGSKVATHKYSHHFPAEITKANWTNLGKYVKHFLSKIEATCDAPARFEVSIYTPLANHLEKRFLTWVSESQAVFCCCFRSSANTALACALTNRARFTCTGLWIYLDLFNAIWAHYIFTCILFVSISHIFYISNFELMNPELSLLLDLSFQVSAIAFGCHRLDPEAQRDGELDECFLKNCAPKISCLESHQHTLQSESCKRSKSSAKHGFGEAQGPQKSPKPSLSSSSNLKLVEFWGLFLKQNFKISQIAHVSFLLFHGLGNLHLNTASSCLCSSSLRFGLCFALSFWCSSCTSMIKRKISNLESLSFLMDLYIYIYTAIYDIFCYVRFLNIYIYKPCMTIK